MPITTRPSTRLLRALADEHDQEVGELGIQLYDWFDPEAFDSLVESAEDVTISVEVDGKRVVYRDGEVVVEPHRKSVPVR